MTIAAGINLLSIKGAELRTRLARFGFSAIAAMFAISGCATTTGGTGSMTDGSAVIGRLSGSTSKGESQVEIVSPQGWTCSGTYLHEAFDGTSTTVPLSCTDGATGTGVVVFERFSLNFVMAFNLSNGRQGSVKFALRPS